MTTKAPDLADLLKAGCMPDLFDPALLEPMTNVVPIEKARVKRKKRRASDGETLSYDFERGDHVELAAELVRELAAPGEVVFTEGRFWSYDQVRARWMAVDESGAHRTIMGFAGRRVLFGDKVKPLKLSASDIAGVTKVARSQISSDEFFVERGAIAFTNGVLAVAGRELVLRPPEPALQARSGFDFDFDPNAQPEAFLRFLGGVFEGDPDRSERIRWVQEFFGACLLGIATRYAVSFVAVGDGANGKSALARIMKECMPDDTVSAVTPQEMSEDYKRSQLVGKHLNVVEELPERDILESNAVKAIISGGYIGARPIYAAPFRFHPIAGHYFAANTLPATTDQTRGFWRRFVPLTFNRTFEAAAADVDLAGNILAAERAAIVSWLAEGARRLLATGEYTVPPSSDATKAAWRQDSDQVALFVSAKLEQLEPDSLMARAGHGLYAKHLYKAYKTWAQDNGHKPLASNRFGARIRLLGHTPKHTKYGAQYLLQMKEGESGDER